MSYYRNDSSYSHSPPMPNAFQTSPFPQPYGATISSPVQDKMGQLTPTTPPPNAPFAVNVTADASVVALPRTYQQWLAQARTRTLQYKELGYDSPVAWVFAEGHNIPQNAIVGGVDRKTSSPWYIVRAFYEGGIELGKAGRQFRLGAVVNYAGRERDISSYEILVEARTPVRWIYQEIVVPQLPATNLQAARLRDFKTVVIVDDSTSMEGQPWNDACEALAGIAELCKKNEADGIDVYFLNDLRFSLGLHDQESVRGLFRSIEPDGQTPTGSRLREVLDKYLPLFEGQNRHKPINLIVITDGVPTDEGPREAIIEAARRLDVNSVPLRQFGIQFVQIGDDEEASIALKELDDDLSEAHGIRDMVDTTLFDPKEPHLRTETLLKILTGAIDSKLDHRRV
ncbi:hypothetical protein FA95DRAFT_1604311 [Auriscalpium vulgare]|uniref:Uncharacterized protein n=1 Tax=Auriscalpium vulgare TaxID=40419 RepID=A0ACB8RYZ5_9AGAM|nr:hypothetical protein FA95DRAFT_1604311 [Auriscalpium vulgare]